MEWKKGSLFGLWRFGSFALYWLVLTCLTLLPRLTFLQDASELSSAGTTGMAWLFISWAVFAAALFVAGRSPPRRPNSGPQKRASTGAAPDGAAPRFL
jgi:succinate-acetate transporter protein